MPRISHGKNGTVPPIGQSDQPEAVAQGADASSYDYTPEVPSVVPRDAALGRYMDAWSRLESAIHYASQEILEIEAAAAYVVWSAIQTHQAIRVLDASARLRLNEVGRKRVARICEQLLRRNTRRNYIIHGTWMMTKRISFGGNNSGYGPWRRVYQHINPDSPKSTDGSDLTISELDKTTDHVEEMIEALWLLVDDIPSLKIP